MKHEINVTQYATPISLEERIECENIYYSHVTKEFQLKAAGRLTSLISSITVGLGDSLVSSFDLNKFITSTNKELQERLKIWKENNLNTDFFKSENDMFVGPTPPSPISTIDEYTIVAVKGENPYLFIYDISPKLELFLQGKDTSLTLKANLLQYPDYEYLVNYVNNVLINAAITGVKHA